MRIAYLDPGLSSRKGHNAAMMAEFDHALVAERGYQVSYLCAASADPGRFTDLRGRLIPTFRIDGYVRPSHTDLFDAQRFARIGESIVADLETLKDDDDFDPILMQTSYPLHLHALAQCSDLLQGRRVVIGMLLPCAFWGRDAHAERRISELFASSVNELNRVADLFAYSETGTFRFGDQLVPMATMLPPLSGASAGHLRRLAADSATGTRLETPTLGFFGSPFTSKGFGLLVEASQAIARSGATPAARLAIRLPAGHEAVCQQLNALAPWIDAVSRQTSNQEYLADMAQVDVVCTLYDPQEYAAKMSGIIPEAISLGKPLLISEGCHAIQDFLERHAPGSFICGQYAAQTLQNILALPPRSWERPTSCSRIHAPLMRQMKCMDRYLTVCGLE